MAEGPEEKPGDALELLNQLNEHVLNLKATWHLFDVLYATPEGQAVFGMMCPATSFEIGKSLVEHLIIQIARILDGGDGDLSFASVRAKLEKAFPKFVGVADYGEELANVRAELEPLRVTIRAHRNAWVAHINPINPASTVRDLPKLVIGDLRRAVELVEKMAVLLNGTFRSVGMSYDWPYADGPELLIRALERGKEAWDAAGEGEL